jgi:hypothetical protein
MEVRSIDTNLWLLSSADPQKIYGFLAYIFLAWSANAGHESLINYFAKSVLQVKCFRRLWHNHLRQQTYGLFTSNPSLSLAVKVDNTGQLEQFRATKSSHYGCD